MRTSADPGLQRPGSVQPGATTLEVNDLAKSFGPTRALRAASLELRSGEIHALVGENGSGKSTLVKILAGIHRPDAGSVTLDGHTGDGFSNPRLALADGIATVFQEVLVVEPRSVLENVWLGTDGLLAERTAASVKRARASAVLEELLGRPVPLDLPVESLSLSERQACCIARAIVREPRVLVLDEATSALDVEVRDRLFGTLRRLVADGSAVIFISHRMDEIADICDRCTVMRSGETVATLEQADATTAELVRLMTGADHLTEGAHRSADSTSAQAEVVLRASQVKLKDAGQPVELELRAGELLGLAGLEGHGQDAFLRALWGAGAASGDVWRVRQGREEPVRSPAEAHALGIGYVPRERRAESLFESKSVRENFGIVTLDRDVRRGLLRPAATRSRLQSYVERLRIVLGDPDDQITTLSGGNQQKVVMARWLATDPAILLLNDPTRGVDLGAKRDLYALLTELAAGGTAIVMLSTEVDEHIELMDRVLVFREHELAAELGRDQLTRQSLVGAFFGREANDV